jgi:hypothetical protein
MAGVGKLLKQAQKMQRQIESLQTVLEAKEIEVTSGGGAVKLKVNGSRVPEGRRQARFRHDSRRRSRRRQAGERTKRRGDAEGHLGLPDAGNDVRQMKN